MKKPPLFFIYRVVSVLCLSMLLVFTISAGSIFAAPDDPVQSPPPNIMLGVDDSGSMDWEMLTTETDGLFNISGTAYPYLFDDPGDQLHKSGGYSYVITGDNRRYWRSQWSEYNRLYYNPAVDYRPWHSGMPEADPDHPRSHPAYDENLMDLDGIYYTLPPVAALTLIKDDRDASGIAKSGSWSTYSYSQAYGGGDSYTMSDNSVFKWIPSIPKTATYQVYVFNAFYAGCDRRAEYTIVHAGGASTAYLDQYQTGGTWALLGTYTFWAGNYGSVMVARRNHPTKGSYTNADAVKFVDVSPQSIDVARAHYFVYSAITHRPYLVNLNGTVTTYQFVDDGDGFIEPGELLIEEAPPADIVTGRTYQEERQNFANWYSYHRKRWGAAMTSICEFLEVLEGVKVGVRSFNGFIIKKVVPIKIDGVDETGTLLTLLTSYRLSAHTICGTPIRMGLRKIGQYFNVNETLSPYEPELAVSPLDTAADMSNQQNFVILFADGPDNGLAPGLGNVDGNYPPPYADRNRGSLADTAMYYWQTDLDGNSGDNQAPVNDRDSAAWQHLVTYTIGLGLKGTLDPEDYDLYNPDIALRSYPVWPNLISNDSQRIDDFWHAAVNGRGAYENASTPEELTEAFLTILDDIMARNGL